ncbi:hypothetical protein [Kitasatospora purpeofusca]|uniref:hypothetical protein n=1 Tax=Kitasatospora purpeofusca TaxID=67352 RepID=UPI00386AE581
MTNQYERLVDCIVDLGIEGTERVKPGTFYELVLVRNTLLYPYQVDGEQAEPGSKWPKKLSAVVRELFDIADAPDHPRWIADTLVELQPGQLVVRRSLADLAERDPKPGLVLIPYQMTLSGLHRAWWGQARLVDGAGSLQWVTEASLLTTGPIRRLTSVPKQPDAVAGFDSGTMPEVPLSSRSDAVRQRGDEPLTEPTKIEPKTAESDED